jgi:hypothetical protein
MQPWVMLAAWQERKFDDEELEQMPSLAKGTWRATSAYPHHSGIPVRCARCLNMSGLTTPARAFKRPWRMSSVVDGPFNMTWIVLASSLLTRLACPPRCKK